MIYVYFILHHFGDHDHLGRQEAVGAWYCWSPKRAMAANQVGFNMAPM